MKSAGAGNSDIDMSRRMAKFAATGSTDGFASKASPFTNMGGSDGGGSHSRQVHGRISKVYRTLSPNFFNAAAARIKPNPGASFNVIHPFAMLGGFSNNSACKGSRSGSNDSTMQPAGVEATSGAWMKQS